MALKEKAVCAGVDLSDTRRRGEVLSVQLGVAQRWWCTAYVWEGLMAWVCDPPSQGHLTSRRASGSSGLSRAGLRSSDSVGGKIRVPKAWLCTVPIGEFKHRDSVHVFQHRRQCPSLVSKGRHLEHMGTDTQQCWWWTSSRHGQGKLDWDGNSTKGIWVSHSPGFR